MVHLIVVNKDEARDIVLSALREKGYDVVLDSLEEGPDRAAGKEAPCRVLCSPERILDALERWFEADSRQEGLYRFVLGVIEKPLIEKTLAKTGGNQLAAARMLGINRNTIRAKIRRFGIRIERA